MYAHVRYVQSSVNLTSGVVLDVGSGVVTCAGVLEGRELPGALSCLPPEASVSKLVDMVHTVTLACEESARVKLQVSIVITGMVCTFDCVECVCTYCKIISQKKAITVPRVLNKQFYDCIYILFTFPRRWK